MKKILLSGATGLIGSHLIPLLKKYEIYALSHRTISNSKIEGVQFINLDFTKEWTPEMLPANIDMIIHLSQSEYFRDFPNKSEDIFRVNTLSTLKLLEFARKSKVKSFIYASSAGIYGYANKETSEDSEIKIKKDIGFYLGTKLCSEILIENYIQFFNIVILRPFFIYGPGQRPNMLIPRLISSIKTGRPIVISGKEGITITPTYVIDAANAIVGALKLKGFHKVNITGLEKFSIKKISQIIGNKLQIEPIFKYMTNNQNDSNLIGSAIRMSKLLHKPKISFQEGISYYLKSIK